MALYWASLKAALGGDIERLGTDESPSLGWRLQGDTRACSKDLFCCPFGKCLEAKLVYFYAGMVRLSLGQLPEMISHDYGDVVAAWHFMATERE